MAFLLQQRAQDQQAQDFREKRGVWLEALDQTCTLRARPVLLNPSCPEPFFLT